MIELRQDEIATRARGRSLRRPPCRRAPPAARLAEPSPAFRRAADRGPPLACAEGLDGAPLKDRPSLCPPGRRPSADQQTVVGERAGLRSMKEGQQVGNVEPLPPLDPARSKATRPSCSMTVRVPWSSAWRIEWVTISVVRPRSSTMRSVARGRTRRCGDRGPPCARRAAGSSSPRASP